MTTGRHSGKEPSLVDRIRDRLAFLLLLLRVHPKRDFALVSKFPCPFVNFFFTQKRLIDACVNCRYVCKPAYMQITHTCFRISADILKDIL